MLKPVYIELLSAYTKDVPLILENWNKIEQNYSGIKRYYHNLSHLENMYRQLLDASDGINDWSSVVLALFYHDLVYDPLSKNNEEKSAAQASATLEKMLVPHTTIDSCTTCILATKKHERSDLEDANFFIDADLSILGATWDIYLDYCKNIRKEYNIYPDIIYRPGRKKVVQRFLEREEIFKTETFRGRLEERARTNLQKELAML